MRHRRNTDHRNLNWTLGRSLGDVQCRSRPQVPADAHVGCIAAERELPQIAVQGTMRALWARRNMPRTQAIATANHLVEIGNRPEAIAEGQAFFKSGVRVTPVVR